MPFGDPSYTYNIIKRFDALCATLVCASTLCGATAFSSTSLTAVNISANTIIATSIKSSNLTASGISGSVAISAGEVFPAFVTNTAGKMCCATTVASGYSTISADALLSAAYGGVTYYIPCFSAWGKQA